MTVIEARQKQRYDTAANWTANNPLLLEGELGVESDTNKIKVGTGTLLWNSLPYIESEPSTIDALADVEISTSPLLPGAVLIYNDVIEKWVPGPVLGYYDPSTDDFYNNLTLLLRFNGVPGTSDFIDQSPVLTPLQIGGAPTHSTTQVKFGATSGRFNNSVSPNQNIVISTTNSQGFPFDGLPFTIDMWVYVESTAAVSQTIVYGTWFNLDLVRNSSTTYYPRVNWTWSLSSGNQFLSPTNLNSIPVNTWVHLAVVKDSSSMRIYLNGSRIAMDSSSRGAGPIVRTSLQPIYLFTAVPAISTSVIANGFKGYVDDFRITKGASRYTEATYNIPVGEAGTSSTSTPRIIYSLGAHSDVDLTITPTNNQTLAWDFVSETFKPSNVIGNRISSASPPPTATSPGTVGEVRYDSSFVYICTATNSWVRTPLASW